MDAVGVVRGEAIWLNKSDRVMQQLSTIYTDPSVTLASDPGWNTTNQIWVFFGCMESG